MNEPLVSSLSVRGKKRERERERAREREEGREGLVPKQDKYLIISARYSAEEAAELQKQTAVR